MEMPIKNKSDAIKKSTENFYARKRANENKIKRMEARRKIREEQRENNVKNAEERLKYCSEWSKKV